ncbi:hypothetical protein SAMN02982989_2185 [Xaviernesmea oryzae]|uniref:Uncharacterized protein n=1 Tax=Xaviernesmea oryzae TaxID=464029 RepID=A0A1X7F2F4_9HYPH|nr:hypothetical protein [Xaviernesmea oryzae]SMF44232.1 hypothetical protein SAMN02982989_2185 [Xaviernesmea oryzae]
MSRAFDSMRGHIYPRAHIPGNHKGLRASNIILGMLGVMLAMLVIAYGITLVAH